MLVKLAPPGAGGDGSDISVTTPWLQIFAQGGLVAVGGRGGYAVDGGAPSSWCCDDVIVYGAGGQGSRGGNGGSGGAIAINFSTPGFWMTDLDVCGGEGADGGYGADGNPGGNPGVGGLGGVSGEIVFNGVPIPPPPCNGIDGQEGMRGDDLFGDPCNRH